MNYAVIMIVDKLISASKEDNVPCLQKGDSLRPEIEKILSSL